MSVDEKSALQAAARAGKLTEEATARQSTLLGWIMHLPLRAVYHVGWHYSSLVTTPLLAVPIVGWAAYFIINGKVAGEHSSMLIPYNLYRGLSP